MTGLPLLLIPLLGSHAAGAPPVVCCPPYVLSPRPLSIISAIMTSSPRVCSLIWMLVSYLCVTTPTILLPTARWDATEVVTAVRTGCILSFE